MPTLLRVWLVLVVAYLAASIVTFYLGAGYLALSNQFWVGVSVIPAVQGIVLVLLGVVLQRRRADRRELTGTERLTRTWLVLFVVNLLSDLTIGVVGFDLVDLRFEAVAQRLIVPWLQALAIIPWLGISRHTLPYRTLPDLLRKQPFLTLFFLADSIFLVSSWLRGVAYPAALSQAWRPAGVYNGVKAVIAGGLMLGLVLGGRFERRRTGTWVAIMAIGLAVYGSTYFVNWLSLLPDLLFPGLPLLYRWQLVYVPLFVACLAVLWKIEHECEPFSKVCAGMLEIVTLIALVNANIVMLGLFNRPQLPAFWERIVHTGGLLAIAGLWAAACRLYQDTRTKVPAVRGL